MESKSLKEVLHKVHCCMDTEPKLGNAHWSHVEAFLKAKIEELTKEQDKLLVNDYLKGNQVHGKIQILQELLGAD